MTNPLARMRVEYGSVEKDGSRDLDVDWLGDDPATGWLTLLRDWFGEAERAGLPEPNAMVVATVDAEGRPVTRTVLCKDVSAEGITFYTNYESDKGRALDTTPHASLTFPWFALGRQVHLRGPVSRVAPDVTAAYWASRPRGSQLGAWASAQSRPIASREALTRQLAEVTERFADSDVPVPPHWGGYLVAPEVVEFWQGRENRVHNRIRVSRTGGAPRVERLQP